MTTATVTDLQEQVFSGHPHKVDRENGVIHGVKVLGVKSKNGRTYSPKALASAARLYEGIEVNIDHPDRKNPGRERGIRESFGVLKNASVRDDGVWADLHYVRSHDLAEQITERAERFPDKLGLSHNAAGPTKGSGRNVIIEDVELVRSVDLVTRPATNDGLFESEDPENETMKKTTFGKLIRSIPDSHKTYRTVLLEMEGDMAPAAEMEVAEPAAEAGGDDRVKAAFKEAIIAAFDDDSLDMKATMKRIGEILKAHDKLVNGSKKADLPAAESESDSGDAMESETIKQLQAKLNLMESRDEARSVLEEAGVSATRLNVNGYLGQETDDDRTAFLESLKGQSPTKQGAGRPAKSPPAKKSTDLTESTIPKFKTPQERLAFLRG